MSLYIRGGRIVEDICGETASTMSSHLFMVLFSMVSVTAVSHGSKIQCSILRYFERDIYFKKLSGWGAGGGERWPKQCIHM
jgi:hypothetical protein